MSIQGNANEEGGGVHCIVTLALCPTGIVMGNELWLTPPEKSFHVTGPASGIPLMYVAIRLTVVDPVLVMSISRFPMHATSLWLPEIITLFPCAHQRLPYTRPPYTPPQA